LQGLELSREFYIQCAAPAIVERFGERACRVAAGLAGQGSDCLGFDDDISRDHDFGPGCCLWLTDNDYAAFGSELQELYDSLPGEFMGFSRNTAPQGSGRVGVMQISRFYSQFTGCPDVPPNDAAWLRIPEHLLAAATSGEVFLMKLANSAGSGMLFCPVTRETYGSKSSRLVFLSWGRLDSTTMAGS